MKMKTYIIKEGTCVLDLFLKHKVNYCYSGKYTTLIFTHTKYMQRVVEDYLNSNGIKYEVE